MNERIQKIKNYTLGISDSWGDVSCSEILPHLESLNHANEGQKSLLAGRGQVAFFSVEQVGSLVLKSYRRGGVFGKINPNNYFRLGASRPAKEFHLLQQVRQLNVKAPEPLIWITEGKYFYRGWLLMREIPHMYSLADCGELDNDSLEKVLRSFAEQVELLIRAGIYHIDLHPGNVLVDENKQAFLIDFDKACYVKRSLNDLRDAYLCRWRRAVIKHNLPDFLSEYVCAYLRKDFISAGVA